MLYCSVAFKNPEPAGADETAGGEEVFIPLTQKNLTTGGANEGTRYTMRNPKIVYPRAKRKRRNINGKISRGRFTS